MTGILIVDKPADWTSQDVAAKLRGVYRERHVGHGGTLDPMATGVLPVFLGRATRAVPFFESADKEYVAGIRFGVITDTQYEAKAVNVVRRSRENPTAYLVPADHENIDYILSHVAAHGLSYYKIPANSAVMVQHVGGDTTEAIITDEQYTVFANGAMSMS